MWMQIIGWLWLIVVMWCTWEWFRAPIYPADYRNEEGINPDYTEIDDEVE